MQSVSPVEKSPRPKIISTEVHDLSKDKKEHEIWFKATEKEYTEVGPYLVLLNLTNNAENVYYYFGCFEKWTFVS